MDPKLTDPKKKPAIVNVREKFEELRQARMVKASKEVKDMAQEQKTQEQIAKDRKDAMTRFSSAYENFHRKPTATSQKEHYDAVANCRKAGVPDPQMSMESRTIHIKVAREKLSDAAKEFYKNPSGSEEIANLAHANESYISLGGDAAEAKKIIEAEVRKK